jgi:hypothetical protein
VVNDEAKKELTGMDRINRIRKEIKASGHTVFSFYHVYPVHPV